MKQLILVRHGKSSWEYDVHDKDRPLIEKGIKDGHLVAGTFKATGMAIDAIYSSPATRALHTCTIFLRTLKFPYARFSLSDDLYEFSGEAVTAFVNQLDNTLSTVMIFGHNNAFTNVANQWGHKYIENVPTTGLVHLQFDTDYWSGLSNGKTARVLFPKQLKG